MAKGSEPLTSNEMALEAAEETGYPVILKPVAGGGGKGMFVAHDEKDLKNILQLADVTKTKFYFEHYIERSRHIEVQIVADNFGTVLHLGERECSLQRRNQKLLEESPSPALTQEMRQQVGLLAIKAAKSVHYTNIGTVEFLLDLSNNEFYFMEFHIRLHDLVHIVGLHIAANGYQQALQPLQLIIGDALSRQAAGQGIQ